MSDTIDFTALAKALLDRAETLVPHWLPGGVMRGLEYVCGSLSGGKGRSCSVNLTTGEWADFSGDERGRDLISLYAAIHGLNNGQAARQLEEELGWRRAPAHAPATASSRVQTPAQRPEPPPDEGSGQRQEKRRSLWRAVVPVPDMAPPPDFKHWHYTEVEASWEYRFEGKLYGHIVRFRTSEGGKEILPHTWCVDESDGRGSMRWHWKQWDEPRPLYVPATLLSVAEGTVPVVLVEGEKCALAGHQLLGHEFDFVSWPGGSKAWSKADWSWLQGRTVYLWPDCDAKRERLTKAERDAGIDPGTKRLLPETRQPGMAAMIGIGSLLAADQACTVFMCPVPKAGAVADGWDLADAIAEGWDATKVREFIRGARVFVPPDDAARAKAAPTPSMAAAGPGESEPAEDLSRAWRSKLILSEKGSIKPVRENAVLALDGMRLDDGTWLKGAPEAQGVIAYNEFTNDVIKLKPTPWATQAGPWTEVDELKMGEWLVRQHWLPSMPRGTLEEAVRMVSANHSFHPVRTYLSDLVWDGTPRLRTWLRQACLEEDEWDDREPLQKYLARAGTWFLQGMVARVMDPGVKFDYMLILEGSQGMRKSTLLRVLAGDYFADTGLVLGDKDSYQQLQGRWLYEFGELDSFGKAEVTKIKSFIASVCDYFRASFDRRAREYPRQLVFGGTTNEDHYLTDPTGNRRFWPVRVTRVIDIEWVQQHRDQLFAEAMHRWRTGARMYPTPDEERQLFEPQQQQRAVENAIETAIGRYLYDNTDGLLMSEISLVELLGKIGIGIEKLGPGRYHEKQAAAALRRLGWTEGRSSKPGRPRVYRRPDSAAAKAASAPAADKRPTQGDDRGGDDDCPF